VCKVRLQNLERQGVRGQNLENKELARAGPDSATPLPRVMMTETLSGARKQMSQLQDKSVDFQ
jgi:hypothetical protein